MSDPSLHSKTIRPGSLKGYSYYYSKRTEPASAPPRQKAKKRGLIRLVFLVVLVATGAGAYALNNSRQPSTPNSANPAVVATDNLQAREANKVQKIDHCKDNTLDKFIKVSIGERHLWACEGSKTVHDTPIISGLETLPDNLTPRGTYKIYGKTTNTTLKGTDPRGSWSRGVYYWMPFLDNQYGTYGFHDATWRPDAEFGEVDPREVKDEPSRGCVELPLSSAKWVYDWAPMRTTVTVAD